MSKEGFFFFFSKVAEVELLERIIKIKFHGVTFVFILILEKLGEAHLKTKKIKFKPKQ